jgi:hypothetical protein
VTRYHKRGAGTRLNARPEIVGKAQTGSYSVLRRVPLAIGDPENAVCRVETSGEIVALFWGTTDAVDYCAWKNGRNP